HAAARDVALWRASIRSAHLRRRGDFARAYRFTRLLAASLARGAGEPSCRAPRRLMITDLKCAFRMLAKAPGFAVVAIITLSLGIGANTTIFSAIDALLLRPLPLYKADRVVRGYAMREGFDP